MKFLTALSILMASNSYSMDCTDVYSQAAATYEEEVSVALNNFKARNRYANVLFKKTTAILEAMKNHCLDQASDEFQRSLPGAETNKLNELELQRIKANKACYDKLQKANAAYHADYLESINVIKEVYQTETKKAQDNYQAAVKECQ